MISAKNLQNRFRTFTFGL